MEEEYHLVLVKRYSNNDLGYYSWNRTNLSIENVNKERGNLITFDAEETFISTNSDIPSFHFSEIIKIGQSNSPGEKTLDIDQNMFPVIVFYNISREIRLSIQDDVTFLKNSPDVS